MQKIILNFLAERIKNECCHKSFSSSEKWFSKWINIWLSGRKYNTMLNDGIVFLCEKLKLNQDLPKAFYRSKDSNNLEDISKILEKKLSENNINEEELSKCCHNFIQIKLLEKRK
jgi:hypothetical protein